MPCSSAMASASDIFRTPAGPYARIEARRYYKSVGVIGLSTVVVLVMLSVTDFRFAIVALMVVCVVIPMLMLLAWLKLTANPQVQLHMRPQRWTRRPDGALLVEFFPFAVSDDKPADPVATAVIEPDNVDRVEDAGKYTVVHIAEPLPNTCPFFIIPSSITHENPTLLLNL